MAQDDTGIRPLAETDLPEIDDLLAAEAFGEGNIARLHAAISYLRNFSLVAIRANRVEAAALASFNGWHIFLSHLVVAPSARNEGIARLLTQQTVPNCCRGGRQGSDRRCAFVVGRLLPPARVSSPRRIVPH